MKGKRPRITTSLLILATLILLPICHGVHAQDTKVGAPPIEQPLVREGALALKLAEALKLGKPENEVAAESMLGDIGITPRNGWIMDYPVTPDIAGELRGSIISAVDSKKLSIGRDDALNIFDSAMAGSKIITRPYTTGEKYEPPAEAQPDSTAINNYYSTPGPPVVTYYPPPPDYDYLYSWVPYPFWWGDFWFGGYFILHDFHRVIIINKRAVIVTNHFNDFEAHKVFLIDPVSRFNGKTFAGIGAPNTMTFIRTGISGSDKSIFNSGRQSVEPSGGTERSHDDREEDLRPSHEDMRPYGGEMRPPSERGRR